MFAETRENYHVSIARCIPFIDRAVMSKQSNTLPISSIRPAIPSVMSTVKETSRADARSELGSSVLRPQQAYPFGLLSLGQERVQLKADAFRSLVQRFNYFLVFKIHVYDHYTSILLSSYHLLLNNGASHLTLGT
jgi:hypothetical protein